MTAFTKATRQAVISSYKRLSRCSLIRTIYTLRSGDGLTMSEARPSLCRENIVVIPYMIHMRTFRAPASRATIYPVGLSYKSPLFGIILCDSNPFKAVDHIDQILTSVPVMEKRGIKAQTVQIHGLGPFTPYVLSPYHVIMGIVVRTFLGIDYRIYQIEPLSVIRQTRSPYSARIRHTLKLPGKLKRALYLLPCAQVL